MLADDSKQMNVRCEYTELLDTATLKPNPLNPNIHPLEQIERLAKILVWQGWRSPIVLSKQSGLIVKGHGRLEAAKAAGFTVVPVDWQDYESEAQEHADMIADNRIPELAEWERAGLKDMLQELDTGAFPMELVGYSEGELEAIMASAFNPDAMPNFSDGKTTEEDIDGAEAKLTAAYQDRNPETIEVTCPHCAEGFLLNKDEAK